jgi:hypothetical protein
MAVDPLASPPTSAPRGDTLSAPATGRPLRATPAAPRVSVVDLRVSASAVSDRATQLVDAARARGVAHSMRLWREAQREALLMLARQAGRAPIGAECRSLAWVREETGYHVSAAFTVRPVVH